ncbi:hypothetical protein [Pseudovibrio sp. Tun.PSC04-5.I4]
MMAQANADEGSDVAPPQADRDTAKLLGGRIAEIAKLMTRKLEMA